VDEAEDRLHSPSAEEEDLLGPIYAEDKVGEVDEVELDETVSEYEAPYCDNEDESEKQTTLYHDGKMDGERRDPGTRRGRQRGNASSGIPITMPLYGPNGSQSVGDHAATTGRPLCATFIANLAAGPGKLYWIQ
jgi:hypothetical protein